jgi:chromosome segregation ATPase
MAVTVKHVGLTFVVSVVILLLYTLYYKDSDQLNNLVQSQSKALRLYNELKNDLDDIVDRQQRDESLRTAAAESFVRLQTEVRAMAAQLDTTLDRVAGLVETVDESTSRLQTLSDSVLETSDHFDEVKLEFSALKHATLQSSKQM